MKEYALYPTKYYPTFEHFIKALAEFGNSPAICFFDRQGKEHVYSYHEFYIHINALKRRLLAMGAYGKHIAIAGENSYEWLVAFLAITSAGGVAVCVDTEQPDETVRQLIVQADSSIVFTADTFFNICLPLLSQKKIEQIILLNSVEEEKPNSIAGLIAEGGMLEEEEAPEIKPDQPAAIAFTSGTTSVTKPVMLSNRNLLDNAGAAVATVDLKDNIFTSLPFFHTYGLNCGVICSLLKGARLTINGDLKTMMRDMYLASPKTIITVPLVIEAMYKYLWLSLKKEGKDESLRQLFKKRRLCKKIGINLGQAEIAEIKKKYFGNMEIIVTGGAHMDPELSEKFLELGILVFQGYGITECSPLVSVSRNESWKLDSVGVLLPCCGVKVVAGEIWIKGTNVTLGYYNDPVSTAEAIEDGWFKTGDLGEIDEDGFLHITGRNKNLIVLKNGKKISPEKIEFMLKKIPLAKEVLVYGAPSGEMADDVKPAVSIYPNTEEAENMTSYEILEYFQREIKKINDTLPVYQQIQMIDIREKEFAKTSTKKIKRYLA